MLVISIHFTIIIDSYVVFINCHFANVGKRPPTELEATRHTSSVSLSFPEDVVML